MRAAVAAAERRHEVRTAAASWLQAGWIDETARRAIDAAYPDDRIRLNRWIRAVAFVATLLGGLALASLVFIVLSVDAAGASLFAALAAAFAASTELQIGRFRRAQCGSEDATALLAVALSVVAAASFRGDPGLAALLVTGAVACGVAAWRWGSVFLAGVAVFLTCCWIARFPHGRLLWFVLGAVTIPLAWRATRSIHLAPSHRRGFQLVLIGALIAVYVAVNLLALDRSMVETLGERGSRVPPDWLRVMAAVGTGLVPLLILAAGVVLRDRSFLVLGTAALAASLATVRYYHTIAPTWLCLVLGGGSCFAIALGLRRWFHAAPLRERMGLTAEPLLASSREREAAQVAAVLATLAPAPRTAPDRTFEGGGGLSGGGGASGTD